MIIGDEVKVRVLEKISENKVRVEEIESGQNGILLIKDNIVVNENEVLLVWVINIDKELVFGNSKFGSKEISYNLKLKYQYAIQNIFENPSVISDIDISNLKGMVNSCIKKDQPDWLITYSFLGHPSRSIMGEFICESVIVRNALREKNIEPLLKFRKKFIYLLKSMEDNLKN